MEENKSKYTKKDIIKVIILAIIAVSLMVITIKLLPYVLSLKDDDIRNNLKEYITSKGFVGVLILLGFQVLQVVVAVIPGEIVEVIAGLLYGTIGGYIVCTIGILVGSVIIYYTVRALGYKFINNITGGERFAKFKFLHDAKKLDMVIFLLFFIPGTPKDILTYFIPFTKIKPLNFFIISTIARIPSIVSSTFAGASIGDGKWGQTVIIFVVIGAIGILGILFNEKILKKFNRKSDK